MKCESVREQLTAYLDGELTDDRGSAVRGHLRGCDACRNVATNEAALRDGLRSLPPVDPPASLWANVQARLAAEEVADAKKPAWHRALSRWMRALRPQLAIGSVAVAAAVIFLVVRHREPERATETVSIPPVVIKSEQQQVMSPAPTKPEPPNDVTAQVAAEPAELTQGYADTVKELREMANEERAKWSDDKKRELDTQLATFDKEVASAKTERARQKSYRAQIRFLQRALIVDEVALASGGTP